jgi:hypothetical protein
MVSRIKGLQQRKLDTGNRRIGKHQLEWHKQAMVKPTLMIGVSLNTLVSQKLDNALGEIWVAWCGVLNSVGFWWKSIVVINQFWSGMPMCISPYFSPTLFRAS